MNSLTTMNFLLFFKIMLIWYKCLLYSSKCLGQEHQKTPSTRFRNYFGDQVMISLVNLINAKDFLNSNGKFYDRAQANLNIDTIV